MNNSLSILFRGNELNPEKTMFVLNTVLAMDTELASSRQQRAYRRLHTNAIQSARAVIRDFTSRTGMFNLDHVAWQLGVDTSLVLSGSDEPCPAPYGCPIEGLIYVGHYVTPGRGVSYKCSTCSKTWSKIGDQYAEAEAIIAA